MMKLFFMRSLVGERSLARSPGMLGKNWDCEPCLLRDFRDLLFASKGKPPAGSVCPIRVFCRTRFSLITGDATPKLPLPCDRDVPPPVAFARPVPNIVLRLVIVSFMVPLRYTALETPVESYWS